jgi:hypothetical protein
MPQKGAALAKKAAFAQMTDDGLQLGAHAACAE